MDVVEKADMAISMDVIYHLIEENVFEDYMYNLFNSASKYVCIYARNENRRTAMHIKFRKFSTYIEEKFPDWTLEKYIKNRYPYDEKDPDNTSPSDFYLYKLK